MEFYRVSTNASKRLKGIQGSNFSVDLEYNKTYIIIHLPYVSKFTKSTLFEMQYLLDDWWKFFKTVGYTEIHAAVDPNNRPINRLLRYIKFKQIGSSNGMNIWSYRGD
jgi:RimJ/RimL family protein N-acetyltransferase